jgi:thioesterase domain-containing protein
MSGGAECDPQLIPLRATGTRRPLFCFPARVGEHVFLEMVTLMRDDQPVYVIELAPFPGGLQRLSVKEIAKCCCRAICEEHKCGPYHLCGYSFGALVAYEVASQLAAMGREIGLLALFDAPNPAFWSNLSVANSIRFKIAYCRERFRRCYQNLLKGGFDKVAVDVLKFLSSRTRIILHRVRNYLEPFGVLNISWPEDSYSGHFIITDAYEAYIPSEFYQRLVLFRSQERGLEYNLDLELGWGAAARGRIDVHVVPGDHLTMVGGNNARFLVEKLNAYLIEDDE